MLRFFLSFQIMNSLISDVVLVFHFIIIIFISTGFFIVPIGYKMKWVWLSNLKLRSTHLGLICFITFETIIGMTCPLTLIENVLNENQYSQSFVKYWISKIVYWDFPTVYFVILYLLCTIWTVLMWSIFPPRKKH